MQQNQLTTEEFEDLFPQVGESVEDLGIADENTLQDESPELQEERLNHLNLIRI